MINISEYNITGIQANLNKFSKELYGVSNASKLYKASLATIPNNHMGMSKVLEAQMNAYRSTVHTSDYLEQILKATKPLNGSWNQINSKTLQSLIASQTNKEIESMTKSFLRNVPTTGFAQSSAISKELRKTMEPLFNSGNLKTMTTANNLLNKISANPYDSYKALQKAIDNQATPGLKELDKAVRNQIKQVKNEYNESKSPSNIKSREIDTKAAIKELQNPIKVNEGRDKHIKLSVEYFNLFFQLIASLLIATGAVNGDREFEILGYILGALDRALNIHFINHNKNNT